MSASRKLRTAHFLMFIGLAPLVFAVILAAGAIVYSRAHPGQAGASDAFLLIAMFLFGYATTLVLGGPGALWSWYLTRRGIDKTWRATVVLRTMVAFGLFVPLIWYISRFIR